jgi:hypothetical protein
MADCSGTGGDFHGFGVRRQKSGNRKASGYADLRGQASAVEFDGVGKDVPDAPPRHCEERSDVAIQAAVQLPQTPRQPERSSGLPRAYGPRNDGNGVADVTNGASRRTLTVNQASLKRGASWGVFVLLPCLFLLSGWRVEPWPVLRAGAVQGEVGP